MVKISPYLTFNKQIAMTCEFLVAKPSGSCVIQNFQVSTVFG